MRKLFFLCILNFLFCTTLFSQAILNGIWQGNDRLILFEENDVEEKFDFAVVLRIFYRWYDDRAAESSSFSELKIRDKNDTEARSPENISIRCNTILENESKTAGVYELELIYPSAVYSTGKIAKNESVFIPIAVIDDKIYLDFLINKGFWACASNADGITISTPRFKKEVSSFYIAENDEEKDVYKLRYWKSEMDYTEEKASFSDGNKVFEVNKYLKIGKDVYQCTTGRSSKIRNIEKTSSMPNAVFDSENTICAFGKPYLVKVQNVKDKNDLLKIIEENNKRRKDPPKPLFPVKDIDFKVKDLTEKEMANPFTWNRRNVDIGK